MCKKLHVCNVCLNARGTPEGKSVCEGFSELGAHHADLEIPVWVLSLWAVLGTAYALGHSVTLLWQA